MTVMIAGLLPAAPLLIPELCGAERPAEEARAAAFTVLRALIDADPDAMVMIAQGTGTREVDTRGDLGLHRFGGMAARHHAPQGVLPPTLAVGLALVRSAGWAGATQAYEVDAQASLEDAQELGRRLASARPSAALVLLGNGSARSTAQAPGSLHPQAADFNQGLVDMVSCGDTAAIAALSTVDCAEQLSDVRGPLQVLTGVTPSLLDDCRLAFAQEISGVFYLCAIFQPEEGARRHTRADTSEERWHPCSAGSPWPSASSWACPCS